MQTQLRQAVVVAFGRTPYCKARKGSFAQLHPVEYGAQTLLGVLARVPQLRPEDIGDVIMGCAMPFGVQGGNMARLIVQRAGCPTASPPRPSTATAPPACRPSPPPPTPSAAGRRTWSSPAAWSPCLWFPCWWARRMPTPGWRSTAPRYTPPWASRRKMWPASGASAGPIWTPWPLRATAGPPRPGRRLL